MTFAADVADLPSKAPAGKSETRVIFAGRTDGPLPTSVFRADATTSLGIATDKFGMTLDDYLLGEKVAPMSQRIPLVVMSTENYLDRNPVGVAIIENVPVQDPKTGKRFSTMLWYLPRDWFMRRSFPAVMPAGRVGYPVSCSTPIRMDGFPVTPYAYAVMAHTAVFRA